MRSRKMQKVRPVHLSPPALEWLEVRCLPSAMPLAATLPPLAASPPAVASHSADDADSGSDDGQATPSPRQDTGDDTPAADHAHQTTKGDGKDQNTPDKAEDPPSASDDGAGTGQAEDGGTPAPSPSPPPSSNPGTTSPGPIPGGNPSSSGEDGGDSSSDGGGPSGATSGGSQPPTSGSPPPAGGSGGSSASGSPSSSTPPPSTASETGVTDSGKSLEQPEDSSHAANTAAAGTSGSRTATGSATSPTLTAAPATEKTASESTDVVSESAIVRLSGPPPANGVLLAVQSATGAGAAPGQGVTVAVQTGIADTSTPALSAAGERAEPVAEMGDAATLERTASEDRVEVGVGREVLRPESAGFLLAPPAADTRVLDLALQQLLDQIDHLGSPLKDPAAWRGTGTWLAAGMIVLAGAEVQRRRRAVAGAAFTEGAGLGWEGPEDGDKPDA